MRNAARLAGMVLLTSVVSSPVRSQAAASLTLIGEDGASKSLTMAELVALPQTEATVTEADSSRSVYGGPSLRSLMTLIGAPEGWALRGPAMTLAVLAEASDGYRAGFMLSEIDEQFGARVAFVAVTQNGHALTGEGPLRIVVPAEEHRARWVRELIRLKLVRVQ